MDPTQPRNISLVEIEQPVIYSLEIARSEISVDMNGDYQKPGANFRRNIGDYFRMREFLLKPLQAYL